MFFSIASTAQSKNWYVSLSVAYGYSGTRSELTNAMLEQKFNEDDQPGVAHKPYPFAKTFPSVMLNVGKPISKKLSIFFAAGLLDYADVNGRKISAQRDHELEVRYNLMQLTAGIALPLADRGRFGIGASLLALSYIKQNAYDFLGGSTGHWVGQTITGGLYNFLSMPLGKGKKSIGLELFAHSNLSPRVRMELDGGFEDFTIQDVSIINVAFGLALKFQKKNIQSD